MLPKNECESYCIEDHSLLLQELNEAKHRVLHLERTIKWWSECTATWREKWGAVRAQRNKLREDQIISRAKYKSLTEEYAKVHSEKDRLIIELEKYNSEKRIARIEPFDVNQEIIGNKNLSLTTSSNSLKSTEKSLGSLDFTDDRKSHLVDYLTSDSLSESAHCVLSDYSDVLPGIFSMEEERIINMVPVLQEELESLQDYVSALKLQESTEENKTSIPGFYNTDISEKLEKIREHLNTCRFYMLQKNRDIHDLQSKNVKLSKHLQTADIPVDDTPRTSLDHLKTKELHNEIRRLQQENCNEWTRREQAESCVSEIQRRLNSSTQTITELQEALSKKITEARNAQTKGMQLLNDELNLKSKSLIETKVYVSKLKKQNSVKEEALVHETKRTEQYEREVKKLRVRITELKQELLSAEDKIDHQGNDIRRLQRSLEDQSQANEVLQAQVHHIQARLKRQNATNRATSVDVETSTMDMQTDMQTDK